MYFVEKLKINGKVYKLRDWVTIAICILQIGLYTTLGFALIWVITTLSYILQPPTY